MYFRLSCLCLCLIVVLAATSLVSAKNEPDPTPTLRQITVVKDIRNFAKSHAGLSLMRLSKEQSKTRNQSVRYTLGGRVPGDRLAAQGSDVFSYPAKKDVTIQLTYPEAGGTGSIVTYIEIVCSQDNNAGNAYIVAGGIGQRFISIVVESSQTEHFSYAAQFFGTN